MKNRMLEIGTSGTVRGEDGNILTYSAVDRPHLQMHRFALAKGPLDEG